VAARPSSKAGLARLLKTLEGSGDIALVDDALVAMAKGLAAAVDADPSNAALWREYRQVWVAVKEAAAGGIDDDTASFLVTVRTPGRGSAQVVDTEDA
jgi:hypothetical protein